MRKYPRAKAPSPVALLKIPSLVAAVAAQHLKGHGLLDIVINASIGDRGRDIHRIVTGGKPKRLSFHARFVEACCPRERRSVESLQGSKRQFLPISPNDYDFQRKGRPLRRSKKPRRDATARPT